MGTLVSRAVQIAVAVAVCTAVLAACGSGEESSFVDPTGEDSGGIVPPAGNFGPQGDSGTGQADPRCKPRTCAEQNIKCGPAGDGCGGIIADCGKCGSGERCGGPGAPSQCVKPSIGTGCVPQTCVSLGVECGLAGDGCGGTLTCGTCGVGKQCGSTANPSKCVSASPTGPDGGACVAKTCASYAAEVPSKDCGVQSDGCGGTVNCGGCAAPAFCGGGGPSKCAVSGGGACVPKTCADFPGKCGAQPNGCGGVTPDCGGCVAPQICGGGAVASTCGGGGAGPGGGPCVPKAVCAAQECGKVADGCGGVLDCGVAGCAPGTICGGAGTPNVCGAPTCNPIAVCPAGKNCGSVADGCGGLVQCGNGVGCVAPQICGGGGVANVCGGGAVACVPKTCAQTGLECGPVADGCGGLVQCGATCPGAGVCGAVTPNVCGAPVAPCTGFCQQQDATCAAGSLTQITGKVYAPNGTLPLPGALVYIPNGAATSPYGVTPITPGVVGGTCEQCNQTASGSPLVSTTSAFDGSFTLPNVPAGVSFPLVIQLGKWRRMVTIPATTRCTSRTLTSDQSRFPTRQNEGTNGVDNVPFIAISTGQVDGLECVLRKIGLTSSGASNQFGNPVGTSTADRGRIRLYRDNDVGSAAGGARIDGNTPRTDTGLTDTQAHLDQYDAVIFGCAGARNDRTTAILDRVRAYADKGGRVFATHFEYVYLYNRVPWDATVAWDTANARSGDWTGEINTGSTKRLLFSQWLNAPGVAALSGTSPPRVTINEARNNADRPVAAGAEEWITRYNDAPASGGNAVLHYTFNTPWAAPAANQCGRVLFSDFHVTLGNTAGQNFPDECSNSALTSQEKILAFFLFDLTSCIQTPPLPTCTARTCSSYPAGTCGVQSDGCGGTTPDCGTCPNGQTCGGGGVLGQCGGPTCTARTCAQQGADCGTVPDGCGGTVNCAPCAPPATCGGGGVAYKCGISSCAPTSCQAQGIQCGQAGDGCGNVITCPACPAGTTCGGGGIPNQCGAPACNKLAACPPGKNCGLYPDGCGGSVDCGNCAPGLNCGGGGAANVCGAASCSPKTCAAQGLQCGTASDGCGGIAMCSPCPPGDYCNAANQCVSPNCTPKTCTMLGVQCGPTADTCGGLVQCGDCPPGQGCGAGGVPGKCGSIACTPRTCNDLGAVCGQVANGCGALTPSCGTCVGALSCKNGVCVDACKPKTCAEAGANCGPISDGCGGLVECGPCPPGQSCGYNGVFNVCGSDAPK